MSVVTGKRPYCASVDSLKKLTMPRKQSLKTVKNKAHELLQRLVRMKAADENGYVQCVSCGVVRHYKQMDGGHFISRTYSFHSLREENIHPQCKGCNRFFGKCHDDYRRYMVEMYGEEFVNWLTDTKWTIHKWSIPDLNEQIAEFKQRIKDQEIRRGERVS